MFESRRKQSGHTVYRALLWTLATLIAVGVYLDRSPVIIDAEQDTAPGIEITRQADSNVLIVLDYQAIRASGPTFSKRDFSVAWINLFEQVIGPVSIATPTSLSLKAIQAARVIVLTSSVADQVPDQMLEKFRQHTLKGNVIVVERPRGKLRQTFSANGAAGVRSAQKITFARGLPEPYQAQLLKMPLSTQFIGSTAPRNAAVTHLAIDGAPAIYAVPIGLCTAITVDFDLGEQMVAMQQGLPDEHYRVQAKRTHSQTTAGANTPKTSDLMMDPALASNSVPYADLLERFIVYGVISQYAPMPTFWPFPDGAQGALIAVHEDKVLGDGGGWMLDYEVDQDATSTLLTTVDAGLSASQAAVLARMGAELGLSYQKPHTPEQINTRVGFAGFKPIAQPIGLGEQLDKLRKTLPSGSIRTMRITDSWWDTRWSHPFELMAAQHLRIDTSYSPAPGAGYAFGTGFPFLVVNSRGEPLGIREMPVVYPSNLAYGQDLPKLSELIAQSSQGHHQAITWAVSPSLFADYPDMKRFEQWLSVFEIAKHHGHVVTSVARFDRFQRSRRAGRIQSQVILGAVVPSPELLTDVSEAFESDEDTSNIGGETATLLRITVNAKRGDLSLTIPAEINGKSFMMAKKNVNPAAQDFVASKLSTREVNMIGFRLLRIPLDAGFSTIDAYYQ